MVQSPAKVVPGNTTLSLPSKSIAVVANDAATMLLTVHVLLLPLVSVPSAAFELLSVKGR